MSEPAWLTALPEIDVADGTDILVEGVPTQRLYVLTSGTLRIHRDGLDIDRTDRAGTFLGEMALLLGGAPRATVTSVGACTLRYTEDGHELMRTVPEVAISVAEWVAQRLDLITGYLSDLRVQYADRDDHLSLITQVLQTLMNTNPMQIEPGSAREPDAPY